MPDSQPEGGVFTRDKRKPKVSLAEISYCLGLDVGPKHREELVPIVSLNHFYEEYLSEIEIDGVRIPLSAELPPLPIAIAKYILQQPTSIHRELEELLDEIDVGSTNDLLQIAGPLPKE